MENKKQPLPSKDEVIAQVIDIFIHEVGFIERHEISPTTNVVEDFRIDTDDLTIFARAVDKHFGIHPHFKEWSTFVATIENIAEFVLRQLGKDERGCATP